MFAIDCGTESGKKKCLFAFRNREILYTLKIGLETCAE
jgi:hypothetical protein